MLNYKIGFFLDKEEIDGYPDKEPTTSYLLIKECSLRGYEVFIFSLENLFLNGNNPEALAYKVKFNNLNCDIQIKVSKAELYHINLNDLDMLLIRKNPPIDINYIFSCQILDYIDQTKTVIINSPSGIKKCNEKLYIHNFPEIVPKSIVTSNIELIKNFIDQYNEIVVKPLNNYAGNGIFYLQKNDKNLNSILENATNNNKTVVFAQEYLKKVKSGDKRLILLGGEPIASVIRTPAKNDFRANMCKGSHIKIGDITEKDKEICKIISKNLLNNGLFFVGLDLIDDKIIETNVTSPGFFIRKINLMLNIRLEEKVVDYMKNLISSRKLRFECKEKAKC